MMLCRKSIKCSVVFYLLPQKSAKIHTIQILETFLPGSPVAVFAIMEFLRGGTFTSITTALFYCKEIVLAFVKYRWKNML